jgi:hypothetical protein
MTKGVQMESELLLDGFEGSVSALPPSIIPVVILSGSEYRMGYQYGQQAGLYIERQKNWDWVSALTLFRHDEVLHELRAYEWHLKKHMPEILEMLRGIAEGATDSGHKVSYEDVLLLNNDLRRPVPCGYPSDREIGDLACEGCTSWSAWGTTTADGRLICGSSADAPFAYQVAIIAFPMEGNAYLSLAGAGQVSRVFSINAKGLFLGGSGGYGKRTIDFGYGIPRSCARAYLLRCADSAIEARDLLFSLPLVSAYNLQLVDVTGNAFVCEVTAAIKTTRTSGDFEETNFIYSTNNFFNAEMQAAIMGETFVKHGGWLGRSATISAVQRNLELWTMLHGYMGKIDLDFAKMLWRFPGSPPPTPLDSAAHEAYFTTQGEGWDQKICNLANSRVAIGLPDNAGEGLAYVCTGPAGRIAYPHVFDICEHYYQVAGTHSFYQLTLASDPAAVVDAAQNAAHDYIAIAHNQFARLDYTDCRFSEIRKLYSLSNAEYYLGVNARNEGSLKAGDTSLFHFAQATTAFARAQAHALEAYNALVPPPSRPEDLGLEPYAEVFDQKDDG